MISTVLLMGRREALRAPWRQDRTFSMRQSSVTIALWPTNPSQSRPLPASALPITQLVRKGSQQEARGELQGLAGSNQAQPGRA